MLSHGIPEGDFELPASDTTRRDGGGRPENNKSFLEHSPIRGSCYPEYLMEKKAFSASFGRNGQIEPHGCALVDEAEDRDCS